MAIEQSFIPIGATGENLDSVRVDTPAGLDLHRETVIAADPEDPNGLGRVVNTEPASDVYAAAVRAVGVNAKLDSLITKPAQLDALTEAQLRAAPVVVDTGHTQPMTGTNSSVTASVTAVTLLASNGPRRGATVYNDSTSPLKLSLGNVVTASSFTLIVAGGGYYEVPFGYRGAITGLWAAAIGAARVTELT